MKKNILIINTGGTISCIKTSTGYAPLPGYVEKIMQSMPILKHPDMPAFFIKEYMPLLDSSNMELQDWNGIAQDIADNYRQYDGFVILHGTDTMAYTASILSFMLENLNKPIILTGSQIPLSEVRNDAADNIITSLWLCAHQPFNEVCIYFNNRLLRGNRTTKVSAQNFLAFDSPNYPYLAAIGTQIQLHTELLLPPPTSAFHLQKIKPAAIANFRIFPGFSLDTLAFLLQQPLQGLILETYGAGNAPNNNPHLLTLLAEASKRGIILVNCTQCQQGYVEMHQYATGFTLKQAGLVSGLDITKEAAHCKLLYLLSKSYTQVKIRELVSSSLRGEMGTSSIGGGETTSIDV